MTAMRKKVDVLWTAPADGQYGNTIGKAHSRKRTTATVGMA